MHKGPLGAPGQRPWPEPQAGSWVPACEHGSVQAVWLGGQGHWLWNWADLDCSPAPACVTLDELLVLSEAQFPQLLNKMPHVILKALSPGLGASQAPHLVCFPR